MIAYEEDTILDFLLLPFKLEGSVAVRASKFALPAALLVFALLYMDSIMPGLLDQLHINEVSLTQVSVLWGAATGILVLLLGFRTNRAMARFWEGTGLLHQMRGEWFDSVSCCVTFSRAAVEDKPIEVRDFRHTIVRLMSLCHGSALQEISLSEDDDLETIDTLGLSDATLQHLKECRQNHDFNRVEVCLHLIQSLIAKALDDGTLKVAPPILSRVYQTLSRGFVNLLNAKKIADTRFPFPYTQTIATLLLINMFLTPLLMIRSINSQVWAPIFCFVPLFGMFSLNFIGAELENPFGNDDNDLPLNHFQSEMNKCLMMLLQENADLLPGISKQRCVLDYDTLRANVFDVHKGKHVSVSDFNDYENLHDGTGSLVSTLVSTTASALRGGGPASDATPPPGRRTSRVSTLEFFSSERPELGDADVVSDPGWADLSPCPSAPQSERLPSPLVEPGRIGGVAAPVPLMAPVLTVEPSRYGGVAAAVPAMAPKPSGWKTSPCTLELRRTPALEDQPAPESLKEALWRLQVIVEEEMIRSLAKSAEALKDVVDALPGGGRVERGTPRVLSALAV